MASEKFRHELRQALSTWQQEGLINPHQQQQLTDRYQLDQLDNAAKNRFVTILISLGCLLIGLGVITFIAANWQEMGKWVKVALLSGLFLGVNIGGFTLWQRSTDRGMQFLGQGLLLVGNLSIGAMLGLFAQIFHIVGEQYPLYLWWGLAVLLMAYGLRLKSLSILAIAVIGWGYWNGWWQTNSIWGIPIPDVRGREFSLLDFWINHMAAFAALVFVPLAYLCRSRGLFIAAVIAVASAITNSCITFSGQLPGFVTAIAFLLTPALLYSYDDRLWQGIFHARPNINFQPIAQRLGIAGFGIALYWFAVVSEWRNVLGYGQSKVPFTAWTGASSALLLLVVLVVQWVYLFRSPRRRSSLHFVVAAMFVIAALLLSYSFEFNQDWAGTGMIANVLTGVLGIGIIRESLPTGNRSGFWYGIVLLTLLILTKVMMSQTELLFKALMLVACGIGIVVAGLWFEKYVRSLHRSIVSGGES
jgi:uncharacterized membrane protein